MAYSHTEKITILNYAKEYGTIAAARQFGVSSCTVVRWNRRYKIYETQEMRSFSLTQKMEILGYAEQHGMTAAKQEYNVDFAVMRQWNKKLKIYNQCGRKQNVQYKNKYEHGSMAYKVAVLRYAKEHGPSAAIRFFDVSMSALQDWNRKLKIYPTRTKRKFSDEQKAEIVSYAEQYGSENAARKYTVSCFQINNWRNAIKQK